MIYLNKDFFNKSEQIFDPIDLFFNLKTYSFSVISICLNISRNLSFIKQIQFNLFE